MSQEFNINKRGRHDILLKSVPYPCYYVDTAQNTKCINLILSLFDISKYLYTHAPV